MENPFAPEKTARRRSARSLVDLTLRGFLPEPSTELRSVASQFSVAITPAMLDLMGGDNTRDPIARQFLPSSSELKINALETTDPISDEPFTPVKGIVHRYPDRVLLKLLLSCPVHCRFCFRRDQLDIPGGTLKRDEIEQALAYIRDHTEIWEVILTGGDPLMLPDRTLRDVIEKLNTVEHVKIIRIHTRIPVVDPPRVTAELISSLKGRVPVYVLLHCNHAKELTEEAQAACGRLVDAGIPMLSQSVLLRGVNDTPEDLSALMRRFVETRIKPHYLHHADRARGTGHFRVPLQEGQALLRGLRGKISGLAQPTFMLDIPGGFGKVPVGPIYLIETGSGQVIEDYHGCTHAYDDPVEEPPSASSEDTEHTFNQADPR